MKVSNILAGLVVVAAASVLYLMNRSDEPKYSREIEGEVRRLAKKGKVLPFEVGNA